MNGNIKLDRCCTYVCVYNVTLKCIDATIVAVGKQ